MASHLVEHADLEHKLSVDEGAGVASGAYRAQSYLPHAKVGTHAIPSPTGQLPALQA